MIVVLADDFTGAAEVGAIGRRHGLEAEVHTTFRPSPRAEMVVVDTDTRSAPREEAERRVAGEVRRIAAAGATLLFKKVDSVLRGPLVAELEGALAAGGAKRALVAPFNPVYGQSVVGRVYRVGGVPLDRTRFAHDPEHPAATADVLRRVGEGRRVRVGYTEGEEALPDAGIVMAGGSTRDDLHRLAARLDPGTLAAGGAEFLDVILERRLGAPAPGGWTPLPAAGRTLVVLGSVAAPSRELARRAAEAGVALVPMPPALLDPDADASGVLARWAAAVLRALREGGRAVLTSGEQAAVAPPAGVVPARLAEVVRRVLEGAPGGVRLVASGGATASAVVRRLGWDPLRVVGEAGPGSTVLAPVGGAGHSVVVKPGSYPWPRALSDLVT